LEAPRTSAVPNPTTPAPFSINPWYYTSAPQYDAPRRDPYTSAPQYDSPKSDPYANAPQYDNPRRDPYPITFQNGPTYPIDNKGQTYTGNNLGNGYDPQYDYYDGVSVTNDGFRYYIPRGVP
jgi:hypothetical protein